MYILLILSLLVLSAMATSDKEKETCDLQKCKNSADESDVEMKLPKRGQGNVGESLTFV